MFIESVLTSIYVQSKITNWLFLLDLVCYLMMFHFDFVDSVVRYVFLDLPWWICVCFLLFGISLFIAISMIKRDIQDLHVWYISEIPFSPNLVFCFFPLIYLLVTKPYIVIYRLAFYVLASKWCVHFASYFSYCYL